jgi:autotransporter-associated beta strand protein
MRFFHCSVSPRSFAGSLEHFSVCSSRARFLGVVAGTLLVGIGSFSFSAQALQNATWLPATPGSGDWSTPGNWNPAVPTGTAIFDLSNATTVSISASALVGLLQFNIGAPNYTFHLTSPQAVFEINGAGIANNSTTTSPSLVNDGGSLLFENASTAANSTIVTNSDGATLFTDLSTGGQARLVTNAGGTLDISDLTIANGMTAGSIEGGGTYALGSKTLTVGGNNMSTEVTGSIVDGGNGGGTGARLVKVGGGTLTLSGANSYSGGTTIEDGVVAVNNDGNLGTGLLTLENGSFVVAPGTGIVTLGGGILEAVGGGATLNRPILLSNGGGLFDVETGITFNLNDAIGGTGGLTKIGFGTLFLNGANAYGGGTNVAGGVVAVSSDSNLGTGPLTLVDANLEILSIGGGILSNKAISLLHSGGGIVADPGTTSILSGGINGPGRLSKDGMGTLFLTGANFYSGGTFFNGGILGVNNDANLGAGPLTFDSGTLEALTAGGGIASNKPIDIFNAGGRFLADNGTVSNLSGTITGGTDANSAFTKDGSGTLILSGLNTYNGFTSVALGILKAGSLTGFSPASDFIVNSVLDLNGFDSAIGSLSGTGIVTNNGLNAATLTVGTPNDEDTVFSGVLADGTSRLTFIKAGGGIMIVTGAQTYSGGTLILGGNLQLGDDLVAGSIVGSVVTRSGGALVVYNANISGLTTIKNIGGATVFDNISTAGAGLISSVSGGITLFFDQSTAGHASLLANSGGETLFAGTSSAGNSTITANTGGLTFFTAASSAAGATIVTNPGGSTFFTDSATGDQARLITNAGGIVDVSKVTISKGMTAGSIEGAGTYFLGANALTVGLNNRSTIVSGLIADGGANGGVGGSLMKTGTGTLTLSGLNTYTGGTVIEDGTLTVDGGQALGLGNVVVNGGILNADPQAINVKGNYLQNPGGTLALQVAGASAGQYDFLNVGGQATLGGALQLVSLGFKPVAGNRLTLVTAGGAIAGQFARFIDPFTAGPGFKSVLLLYSAHNVILEFLNTAVPPAAPTVPVVPVEPGTVPAPVIPISIAEVDPGGVTAVFTIGFADATLQLLDLEDILDGARAGCSGFSSNMKMNGGATAPGGKAMVDGKSTGGGAVEPVFQSGCDNRWGVWVTGFGDFVSVDGDANARGYQFTTGGVTLGLDYRLTDHFVIGVMGDYSHTWTALQPAGHIDADTGEGGFYATWYDQGIYVNVGTFGGHNTYETSRANIGGLSTGSTEGSQWSTFVGAGYDRHIGPVTVGPIATLQYTSVHLDGFSENGSLAPLDIHSGSAESLRSDLGLRAFYQWQMGKLLLRPSVKAAWEHEYKYSTFPITAGFAGLPETAQTFYGPRQGQDSAVVSAGVSAQWTPAITVYLNYDGQLGRSHYDANAVTGGFSISF